MSVLQHFTYSGSTIASINNFKSSVVILGAGDYCSLYFILPNSSVMIDCIAIYQ